eukprot:1152052-Pelagomonas_calceolata.AAC.11
MLQEDTCWVPYLVHAVGIPKLPWKGVSIKEARSLALSAAVVAKGIAAAAAAAAPAQALPVKNWHVASAEASKKRPIV